MFYGGADQLVCPFNYCLLAVRNHITAQLNRIPTSTPQLTQTT